MGARGIVYYMSTTICAVILGIILVTTIQPGNDAEPKEPASGINDKKGRINQVV